MGILLNMCSFTDDSVQSCMLIYADQKVTVTSKLLLQIKHFSKLQREHGWDSMRGPLEGVWEKMFPVDEDGRYVSVG